MGTAIIRPDGTVSGNGYSVVGAASAHAALADDSDASYVDFTPGSSGTIDIAFATPSIPATARVVSVTPRIRVNAYESSKFATPQGVFYVLLDGVSSGWVTNYFHTSTSTQDKAGAALPDYPYGSGVPWVSGDLVGLQLRVNNDPDFDHARLIEAYLDVAYNERPTTTVTAPTGSIIVSSRPSVEWTYSDPEADVQERAQVRIFSEAQYTASGFDPSTSIATYDSGTLFTSAVSHQVATPLPNNTNYRAYVRTSDAGSNGLWSAWDFEAFDLDLYTPARVEVTSAATDPAARRVELALTGYDNHLTENQGNMETAPPNWQANANASSLQRASGFSGEGSYVMNWTAPGNGTSSVEVDSLTTVKPGDTYSAFAKLAPSGAPGRDARLRVRWYDSADAYQSETVGPTFVDGCGATGKWNRIWMTATPPAGATKARVVVDVLAAVAAEQFNVDSVVLRPGEPNLIDDAALEKQVGWAVTEHDAPNQDAGFVLDSVPQSGEWAVRLDDQSATNRIEVNRNQEYTCLTPGQLYTLSADVFAEVANSVVCFRWVPRTGLNTQETRFTGLTVGAYNRLSYTFTCPAEANGVGYVSFCSTDTPNLSDTGTVRVNDMQLEPGATGTAFRHGGYSRGGFLATRRYQVERSTDGGSTWTRLDRLYSTADDLAYDPDDLAPSVSDQTLTLRDYEAPRGVALTYRARAYEEAAGLFGEWSPWATTSALPDTGWRLVSTSDAALSISLQVHSEFMVEERAERQGRFEALGRSLPIILSDVVGGQRFPLELALIDDAEFAAFEALRASREVMLLQSPWGHNAYVRFGAEASTRFLIGTDPKRVATVTFEEVDSE